MQALHLLLIGTCVCKQTPVSPLRYLFMLQRLTQTLSTQVTNRSDLLEMSLSPPHLVVQKWESITCLTALPILSPLSRAWCHLPSHCKYWGFLFYGMEVCLFFFLPMFFFLYSALTTGISRKGGSIPSWEKRLEASSLSFPGAHSSAVEFGLSHMWFQDCQSDGLLLWLLDKLSLMWLPVTASLKLSLLTWFSVNWTQAEPINK